MSRRITDGTLRETMDKSQEETLANFFKEFLDKLLEKHILVEFIIKCMENKKPLFKYRKNPSSNLYRNHLEEFLVKLLNQSFEKLKVLLQIYRFLYASLNISLEKSLQKPLEESSIL